MKTIYLIIVLFLLAAISCKQKKADVEKNYRKLLLKEYDSGKVFRADSLFLTKLASNDTVHFVYADSIFSRKLMESGEKYYGYSFKKLIPSDSVLYFDVASPLVAQKTFQVNGQPYTILKYDYDRKNSYDEESSFFYHKNYGTLVCFNDSWSSLIYTIEYDQISKALIDSILNDRTGFYSKIIMSKGESRFLDSLVNNDVEINLNINLDSLDKLDKKTP